MALITGIKHEQNNVDMTHIKEDTNTFIRFKWQSLWGEALNNTLHAIQSSLGRYLGSRHNACREKVVLARIRLRHISYALHVKRQDQPECVVCDCLLTSCWTVAHIKYYMPGGLGYLPRCSAHRATPARPQVGG